MEREIQIKDSQIKTIEKNYERFFGTTRSSQQPETLNQGYFKQFSAYERIQVSYSATTTEG